MNSRIVFYRYFAKLKTRYGDKLTSSIYLAAMWDDMLRIVVAAATRSKGKDADSLKAALEGTKNFKGLMSTYSFSPTIHDGIDPKGATIAYVLGVQEFIRRRVPGMP